MILFVSTVAVVFSFATGVVSVINSFGPSLLEAIAFYAFAMLALLSLVCTACVGCGCCVVGVPLAAVSMLPPGTFRTRRIDAGGNLAGGGGGMRPGIAFGGRPGFPGPAAFGTGMHQRR